MYIHLLKHPLGDFSATIYNKTFVNNDGGWRDEDQLCEEEIPGAKLEKEIEKSEI